MSASALQEIDWANHKKLCPRYCTVLAQMRKMNEARSARELLRRNLHATKLLSIVLTRAPSYEECMPLMLRPACAVCFASEQPLRFCPSCHLVGTCSPEHSEALGDRHARVCPAFQLLVLCERYCAAQDFTQSRYPVWVSRQPQVAYDPLPGHWNDYMQLISMPQFFPAVEALTRNSSSMPLSLVYALEQALRLARDASSPFAPLAPSLARLASLVGCDDAAADEARASAQPTLRLDIIGAQVMPELIGRERFEEILHRLPWLNALHIRFVGNVLGDEEALAHLRESDTGLELCPHCLARGRTLRFDYCTALYHDALAAGQLGDAPDCAVLYNADVNEDHAGTWPPTLLALAERDVPTFITTYDEAGCRETASLAANELGLRVVLPPLENPYRGGQPFVDVRPNTVFYWNAWLVGLAGRIAADAHEHGEHGAGAGSES